jgi:ABC-type Mn2+/Zn2+ transport system permease subunit
MIIPLETVILSALTGVFVGLAAGYLGSLMVLEKMALVGDALSHVALPGLALGILYHFEPFVGAFVFLFISAVVVWQIRRVTKHYRCIIHICFSHRNTSSSRQRARSP